MDLEQLVISTYVFTILCIGILYADYLQTLF